MNILGVPWREDSNTFYKAHKRYGKPQVVYTSYGQKETYKLWHKDFYNSFSSIVVKVSRDDAEFTVPESTLIPTYIKMTPELNKLYHDLSIKVIVEDVFLDTDIKRFAKLKQVVGGFLIKDDDTRLHVPTNKLHEVYQLAEGKKKVAVYAHYRSEVEMLTEHLKADTCPDTFKESDNKYLVMQQTSGALGIDLSFADLYILYFWSYSGTVFTQSINRMLNKKRVEDAHVHVFITEESIEQEAYKMVSTKRSYNIASFRKQK